MAELPLGSVVLATVVALVVLISVAPDAMKGPWSLVATSAPMFGIPYASWLVAARRRRYSMREVMGERFRSKHVLLVLGTVLSVLGVRLGFFALLIQTDLIPESWTRTHDPEPLTLTLKFLELFVVSVVGPCAEEIFFRGLLFCRLLRAMRPMHAALVSSFLFGLMHLDPFGSTLFGLAMVVLYTRTRSLWVPTLAHMFSNLLATLPSFAEPTSTSAESATASVWGMAALLPLGLPWVIWLLRGGRRDIAAFGCEARRIAAVLLR